MTATSRPRSATWTLALLAGLALFARGAWAAPADSLAGEQARKEQAARAVLERASEQAGGLAAWQAARDVRFRMIMRTYAAGVPGRPDTSEVTFRLHGGLRYREVSPGGEVIGCDGRRGWGIHHGSLSTAPVDSLMGMLQAANGSLWFEVPFRFLEPGFRYTHLGTIQVDGRRCDVVQAIEMVRGRRPENCDSYCAYFDPADGKLLGANFTRVVAGETRPRLAVWFSEWMPAGPFLVPTVARWHKLGGDLLPDLSVPLLEYRREDVRFDVDAPDGDFAVPAR
jgi:hypothetical protein